MRILCISDEYPWPPTSGYRLRLANVLSALGAAGSVDLFCAVAERPDLGEGALPPPAGINRLYVHHRHRFQLTAAGIVRWATSRRPRAVAWIDWRHADRALLAWAEPAYDLVWFSHCHVWLVLGGAVKAPAVVDFDNLEDERTQTLLRLRRIQAEEESRQPLVHRLRDRVAARLDSIDIERWRSAQHAAAAAARTVVVCSELDRERLGIDSTTVIANGFDATRPSRPAGRAGTLPVLTMVGLMIYPPNLDGARFFARQVLPRIRRDVPDAVFRVVGRHDGALDDLVGDGVDVLGELDELDHIHDSTAAVVVPLRAGSGTRIKVLEAFAKTLPVASTTIGCEGLGVRDGIELLVGDSPEELAAACVRLLTDRALAIEVAEAGHRLWERNYQWDALRPLVTRVAVEAASGE